MKITEISVKRPVGTILIIIAVLVLGFISIPNIPVSFWPEFVAPSLIVIAPYPGVGPEEIEESIAKPLEEQLSTIDGVEEIETVCFEGACRAVVRFGWGIDFKDAKRDVQEKTARARSRFPRLALEPTVLQVQDFIPPGIELAFTSDERSLSEIRDLVETKVKNRILRLENVAAAQIIGGIEEEVLVSIDPRKLELYGLSAAQVNAALATANADIPAGKIELYQKNYFLRAKGKFTGVQDIRRQIIGVVNGAPIFLQDIADVRLLDKERTTLTRLNGRQIVGLSVREKSGGNTVAMVDEVQAELQRIKTVLPADLQITIIRDQATFIKESIRNVGKNATIGAALAAVIILLFLGNVRNTLIIVLSIPISIIGTFVLINQFGLSINTISLGGLALGVGMIVDASIVVLENIYRHLQEKRSDDRQAAIIGAANEVGLAITSSTLTSIVVFLPMAFLVGLFAVLLGELALTVVFSLSLSIIVALTVVPMLSDKLMHTGRSSGLFGKIAGGWQRLFDKLLSIYRPLLETALRAPLAVIVGAFILMVVTVRVVSPLLDVQMLPSTNQGEFRMDVTLQEGTRLSVTDELVQKIEADLQAMPEIEQVYAIVGQAATLGDAKTNLANLSVRVKAEQAAQITAVMDKVRQHWSAIPGGRVVIKQVTATEGMQREPINVRITGDDLTTLQQLAQQAMDRIRSIGGIINLTGSLEESLPEFTLRIRHQDAAQLGIPLSVITGTLAQAIQGASVTRLSTFGKEYDVTVKMDPEHMSSTADLLNLSVAAANGMLYPLRAVADVTYDRSAGSIRRFDQQRVVIITADVIGAPQQQVRRQVTQRLNSLPLPPDYYLAYGGQSRGIADSFRSLLIALVTAVFLVYVVMGAQFNSFSQPLIIAVTIPLALIGVYAGLLIFGAALSMNALLGMIMLVGIVVNNGILLVDFINQNLERGMAKIDAVVHAGVTRLRPILITSLTTIFGMLPIALGLGQGGEALQPLGAVVAGGLLTSTVLTLVVIPSIFMLFTKGPKRLKRR